MSKVRPSRILQDRNLYLLPKSEVPALREDLDL